MLHRPIRRWWSLRRRCTCGIVPWFACPDAVAERRSGTSVATYLRLGGDGPCR
jgi:hypothetical protein